MPDISLQYAWVKQKVDGYSYGRAKPVWLAKQTSLFHGSKENIVFNPTLRKYFKATFTHCANYPICWRDHPDGPSLHYAYLTSQSRHEIKGILIKIKSHLLQTSYKWCWYIFHFERRVVFDKWSKLLAQKLWYL